MRHLNYNHLLYFWTVAKEGSIAKASELLHVTPQTISGQLKLLEESIGEPLLQKAGRGLALTATGRMVEQYAEEIFTLGSELTQRVKSSSIIAPAEFNVGIVNSIPKLIAYKILEPALSPQHDLKVRCYENDIDALLGDLAVHKLDLVLSDRAIPAGLNVKAYNHELGASSLAFFGKSELIARYPGEFPKVLNEAPVLLPVSSHSLRRSLDDWFEAHSIRPHIVAEFDDSALLKAFGEGGAGFFPAPLAMKTQIMNMYDVACIGETSAVTERYFAISPERKVSHPALVSIIEAAQNSLESITNPTASQPPATESALLS